MKVFPIPKIIFNIHQSNVDCKIFPALFVLWSDWTLKHTVAHLLMYHCKTLDCLNILCSLVWCYKCAMSFKVVKNVLFNFFNQLFQFPILGPLLFCFWFYQNVICISTIPTPCFFVCSFIHASTQNSNV